MMSLSVDYHDNFGSHLAYCSSLWKHVSNFASRNCFEMIPSVLDLALAVTAFGSVCGAHLVCIMLWILAVYVLLLVKTSELDLENRRGVG